MNNYAGNGMSSELAMFETPFAETLTPKEAIRSNEPAEVAYNNFLQELESPFTRTYEVNSSGAWHRKYRNSLCSSSANSTTTSSQTRYTN